MESDKSRSILLCLASGMVGDGLAYELPFDTDGAEAIVFVGVASNFAVSNGTESFFLVSSSSLLGSCGSAGFNGKAGDSSFDLIENDTEAKGKNVD